MLIALILFRNLSGDKEQQYFAEGISEQIRSTLSRSSNLLIIAPTSVEAANKEGLGDARSIARALGVAVGQVNVKAKTAEKIGPVGQGLSIEARAVALLMTTAP